MTYLGELVLIKEEDMQIKEEELEVNHEAILFDDVEGVFSQGEKRSLSPSSSEVLQESKKQLSGVEKNELEDRQTMVHLNSSKAGSTHPTRHTQINESSLSEESINNLRSTQKLTTQTRKMVMKVHDYFRSRNQLLSETDLQIKVAAATGVAVRTVQRVKKEFKEGWTESPPPAKMRWAPVLGSLNDFDEGCVRREILSFYERGEIPTLSTLLEMVKEPPINFPGGRSSLNNLIRKIGFQYKKMEGGRQILMEREDIVATRCKYLRILNNNRNISNPRPEVYVGETYVSQKELLGTVGPKSKTEKGAQFVVVHAGGKKGFVPGGLLIFKPKTGSNARYHNATSPECFRTWLENQLLPNISNNSLIIVNNSPGHSKLGVQVPNRSMKKSDIIHWLVENNIAHDSSISKSELLYLAYSNKDKYAYEIDQIAHGKGHEVLRLPPYHDHLNPIALIWDNVKSEIKREFSNADKTSQKFKNLITDALAKVSTEDWRTHMEMITQIEEEYRNKDDAVDHLLETLTISLDEATTDEED
ncbi:uncharacterized protein LOC127001587 [Eriocheir sinensis]|uniref:uncharacterized protein LOC127001587 n=1 Tax=Eriocheir sinensis TaxID=95602 RepID=UPI0021C5B88D|nr:uncharacterized protein LOC127001587 [Eriocheir sinensis]XP_050722332.1 uncharacterized protein LOC127001587 [Eriocheir sinensis]XP_050722333.1 uncharacterized protein LOC127001587 [Eriocheir sinensis]